MQTETVLNDRVTRGLIAQFSSERSQTVLAQAHSMFQEAQRRSGVSIDTRAEPYELLEGGWIDQALEYLGFGRWAIGRPNLVRPHAEPVKDRFARHIERSAPPSASAVLHDAIDLFLKHIPSPNELRAPPRPWMNAIEYRNFVVIGEPGSGKTTLNQALAYAFGQRYDGFPVWMGIQSGGIDALLEQGTRAHAWAYMFAGDDLTLVRLPKQLVNAFFKVRSLIFQRAGVSRALAVTVFNSHTLFGMDKNLRTSMTMLFVKTVPQNPYDRSLLKRFIDPALLESYEGRHTDAQVLVWDPQLAPHGTLACVSVPTVNVLANIQPSSGLLEQNALLKLLVRLGFMGAITSPVWLRWLGVW